MWRTGKIITEENFMKNVALKIPEGAKPFLTVNIISRFFVFTLKKQIFSSPNHVAKSKSFHQ